MLLRQAHPGGMSAWAISHVTMSTIAAAALGLSGVHGLFARWVQDFAADRRPHTQKFFRIINEIPTVLMIGIVILVVVKPF